MKIRFLAILLVAVFATSLFGASTAMAERLPKIDICHYDEDYGYWVLINVNANSAPAHYENHDDGLPGGATSQTGTELDEDCEPVLPLCGDCLTGPGPGCEVEACEAEVCAIDSFCCDVAWDGICQDEAWDICVGGGICRP